MVVEGGGELHQFTMKNNLNRIVMRGGSKSLIRNI